MKPRISVITLAVEDLNRSVEFYCNGLGFPTEGIIGQEFEYGAVVFLTLNQTLNSGYGQGKVWRTTLGLQLKKAHQDLVWGTM